MKDPFIFVEHIMENISDIKDFSNKLSKEKFEKDKLRQNALIRSIEVIGEAVKNIPDSFKKKHLDVSWKEIAGMRDKLMHHYFGIDLDLVWDVIKKDIPNLEKKLKEILKLRKEVA
jgi:uncharacterized protein with HEPN domain